MRQNLLVLVIGFLLVSCSGSKQQSETQNSMNNIYAIVIHGGAGSITKGSLSSDEEKAYRDKLNKALETGHDILKSGGKAEDAVEQTIKILENSPLFNAGKGAVFNSDGQNELDASIMNGKTLKSGAVTGVLHIKNPISAARMVMDSCKHVMLSGDGAEVFAREKQLELVEASYFYTEKRYQSLLKVKEREDNQKIYGDHDKRGTVGAVALDRWGNIVAGTSTGGLTNKKYGRIGDSPIIGAGTYANNATCGISCTGVGEYFIRTLAAHEASNLIQYKGYTLKQALRTVIRQIGTMGGDGGMIGLDHQGNMAWYFNTSGMFRGYKNSNNTTEIMFYSE